MSMKDNDYICPKCKGHLNVGGYLVFATRTPKKHKGLILLSPKVGEYNYVHHEKLHVKKGELLDIECPICQADLSSERNKEHVMIHMLGAEDNTEYDLYFSKVVGNQSTYLVAHDNVETFGDDALDFEELFYEE